MHDVSPIDSPEPRVSSSDEGHVASTLTTRDGHTLAVRTFHPPVARPRAVLVIASATAVPQRYYRHFAAWMAAAGWRVLTFDYRGTGDSRPRSLRGFDASMREWGEEDLEAVVQHALAGAGGLPVQLVGHSFGGQALALAPSSSRLERAFLVGSQATPIPHWGWGARLRFLPMLYGVGPVVGAVAGYYPGWLGLSEDLPCGVMDEWTRWLRSTNYLFDHVAEARERARAVVARLRFLALTDDEYAPVAAVRDLAGFFDAERTDVQVVSPADRGVKAIGHFGFFRPSMRDVLWAEAKEFLGE